MVIICSKLKMTILTMTILTNYQSSILSVRSRVIRAKIKSLACHR